MENIVEVNGVKYIKKEQNKLKKSSIMLATMMAMFGGVSMGGNGKCRRDDIDVVSEYGLIQLKKSTLSRSDREWVVYVFERNYTILKTS